MAFAYVRRTTASYRHCISQDGSRVFVGYGDGALAVIDPKTQTKVGEISLKAHPESFRLEAGGSRIFVNVPDAHAIAVVDGSSQREIANWPTGDLKANFPLVLDQSGHALAVFRHPARIGVFDGQRVAARAGLGRPAGVWVLKPGE